MVHQICAKVVWVTGAVSPTHIIASFLLQSYSSITFTLIFVSKELGLSAFLAPNNSDNFLSLEIYLTMCALLSALNFSLCMKHNGYIRM